MSAQPSAARAPDRRTSMAPKRTSILPKPSSISLDPSVLIAQHAQLTGMHPITLGANTVLHPHSKISSALARVVLSEGVIVYERAKIGVGMDTEVDAGSRRTSMASARSSAAINGTFLGKNVVVESNAVVEAAEVGEGSVIEVGAVLGRDCIIGKHCTISASSVIPPSTRIPDYTVVYSGFEQRLDRTLQLRPELVEAKMAVHAKQLDMFKNLVPNNIAKWSA